jgi:hypothetical protein
MTDWSTTPPMGRKFAIIYRIGWGVPYEIAQWEPKLKVWACENGDRELADTPWHPLPWPADGRDLSATHELEERRER